MKKKYCPLLIIFTTLLFNPNLSWSFSNEIDNQIEYEALKALYEATDGDNWAVRTNWPLLGNWPELVDALDMDTWFGITMSFGDVHKIELKDNHLVGNLPDAISVLTELRTLELSKNSLSGTLPADIGSLLQLEHLWLNDNEFNGEIPASLLSLNFLQSIYLQNNKFTTLPNFEDLSAPEDLTLKIENNQIPLGYIEQNLSAADIIPNSFVFDLFTYSGQVNLTKNDVIVFIGQGTFTLVNNQAGGDFTHYQWQEWDGQSWVDIEGEITFEYSFVPTVLHHGKRYRCHMTNDWIAGEVFYSDLISIQIFSGKFYAVSNGNWKDVSVWSTTPGGDPVNKYPRDNDTATIDGFHVQVTDEVTCKEINIGNVLMGKLEISGAQASLVVNGEVNVVGASSSGEKMLIITNGGKIECK